MWHGGGSVPTRVERWNTKGRRGEDTERSLLVLFFIIGLNVAHELASNIATSRMKRKTTYVIARFLILVALLVGLGFRLVRLALFHVQSLPSFAEHFAHLAWNAEPLAAAPHPGTRGRRVPKLMPGFSSLTLSRCSLAKNM